MENIDVHICLICLVICHESCIGNFPSLGFNERYMYVYLKQLCLTKKIIRLTRKLTAVTITLRNQNMAHKLTKL